MAPLEIIKNELFATQKAIKMVYPTENNVFNRYYSGQIDIIQMILNTIEGIENEAIYA